MPAYKTTPFFSEVIDGGAITCDLPADWTDVSEIRQVPDEQEVYIGPGDDDPCFVMEILEYQDSIPDEAAARFFFEDLAQANESTETSFVEQVVVPPDNGSQPPLLMFAGVGVQRFTKARNRTLNGNGTNLQSNSKPIDAQIELCVVRLQHVETDLLMTLSRKKASLNADVKILSEEFEKIISTFQILDWDLFGS